MSGISRAEDASITCEVKQFLNNCQKLVVLSLQKLDKASLVLFAVIFILFNLGYWAAFGELANDSH